MRIEIEVREGPEGSISVDGGPQRPFSGWLMLLATLGEVLPVPGSSWGDGDGSLTGPSRLEDPG